jgi:hypothetical protein
LTEREKMSRERLLKLLPEEEEFLVDKKFFRKNFSRLL